MASQQFITSHSERVKKAKKAIEHYETTSIADREAFVEYYLLEDILHLYQYRLEKEQRRVVDTRAGEMAKKRNIDRFGAIVQIFSAAVDIAGSALNSGDYKSVWKAIHEHSLIVAARNVKNLPEMRKLAIEMLKELAGAANEAVAEAVGMDEDLDAVESHDANVRKVLGLPSQDEVEQLIRVAEKVIPDKQQSRRSAAKPNIN